MAANKYIKQREIKSDDILLPYPDITIRIQKDDIELQQHRDVLSIHKSKLKDLINILKEIK